MIPSSFRNPWDLSPMVMVLFSALGMLTSPSSHEVAA
ncbi:hypothetical protein GGQ71_002778 [Rhizobium taibaishanense]|uniref:Uncharacterized protein n=1 Tax=Allorhizobium taibaishanense TaxID=887144 RepID=A0A7W6HNI2_9HYPH|nr:hypothetical protein [Allorhizobium taibaishanense]